MKISVITDILILRFYEYIDGCFGKKISVDLKLIKIHRNNNKKKLHRNVIRSIIDILKLFC